MFPALFNYNAVWICSAIVRNTLKIMFFMKKNNFGLNNMDVIIRKPVLRQRVQFKGKQLLLSSFLPLFSMGSTLKERICSRGANSFL